MLFSSERVSDKYEIWRGVTYSVNRGCERSKKEMQNIQKDSAHTIHLLHSREISHRISLEDAASLESASPVIS